MPPDEVYAPTVGRLVTAFSALPPSAFGDPAGVATTADPSLRLPVGTDAVAAVRAALQARPADLDAR